MSVYMRPIFVASAEVQDQQGQEKSPNFPSSRPDRWKAGEVVPAHGGSEDTHPGVS